MKMDIRNILTSLTVVAILALTKFASVTAAQGDSGSATTEPNLINGTGSDTGSDSPTSSPDGSVGMIVGIVIGVLVFLVVVIAIVVVLVRSKKCPLCRNRKSESDRAAQVQMTSARNAGVYVDLVTSDPNAKDGDAAPEKEALKKQDDEPEEV